MSCPEAAAVTFDLPSGLVGHLCDVCLDRLHEGKASRVYFIRGADMVKIGHSVDVQARMRLHQTGSPVPLELWHTEHGGRDRESELHQMFAADRAQGEWFRISDAIRSYVEGA